MIFKNLAIIDVPLNLLLLNSYINNKETNLKKDEIHLFSRDSIKELNNIIDIYFNQTETTFYKNKSLFWIFKIIFMSYVFKLNKVFLTDLGIKNKLLIIFMRYDEAIILDDGLASIARNNNEFKFIFRLSKLLSFFSHKKKHVFFSIYKKAYEKQVGKFNITLESHKKTSTFEDCCFYICSGPTSDGMSYEDEEILIKKIIEFAKSNKKKLFILPHRRDRHKFCEEYTFKKYVLNTNVIFEEFYLSSEFINCSFITLYSGAMCIVDAKYERFFIDGYFNPKIKKTFLKKIFFQQGTSVDNLYNYLKSIGVNALKFKQT